LVFLGGGGWGLGGGKYLKNSMLGGR